MKLIAYCLAAACLFAASFALTVQYLTFRADTLRPASLFCTSRSGYGEANQALEAGDANWAGRIRECVVTEFPSKARAIGCDVLRCEIRLWLPSGKTVVGYADRRRLTLTP